MTDEPEVRVRVEVHEPCGRIVETELTQPSPRHPNPEYVATVLEATVALLRGRYR